MKGFVKNSTPVWAHAMKRAIGPNQTVGLDELYNQYGKKHGLAEGEEFVSWLRSVKLRDTERWQIVFENDVEAKEQEAGEGKVENVDVEPIVTIVKSETVTPLVPTNMEVKDVVLLSVRKAREVVPKITDLKLLKYAIQEANQLSNKDSLCRILRKRIRDIEISR